MDDVLKEDRRLDALDRYDLLDTPKEEAFDRIVRLTKRVLQVPVATLSVLDAHRQWFKSCDGFPGSQVPREQTFCHHTIQHNLPLIVEDASEDPRFADNQYVTGEPHVRFYAGIPLRTSDGFSIGTLCVIDMKPRSFSKEDLDNFWDLARLAMDTLEMRLVATKDSLTGVLTRRAFKEQAQRAVALALRHSLDLAVAALDIDHFKSVNDTYGHPVGDLVLAKTVETCAAKMRETDLLGRLGGEEFAILLPHTGSGGAVEAIEKLRIAIQNTSMKIAGDVTVPVTASFGIACLGPAIGDLDTLLSHADKALYEAKALGRNRSAMWRPPENGSNPVRRRTLKAGQILFNARRSAIDCTIRSLSEDGAGLDLSSTVGVPGRFQLTIKADGIEKQCRVVAQNEKHLDVAFC